MTDMETGFKLFKKEVIQNIEFEEKSFGIEPEITIKLAKKNYIFFAIKGKKKNGENFIKQAIKKGASVIICSNNVNSKIKIY